MAKIAIKMLHQQIAARIRDMIQTGQLDVGERIVEGQLCEALGVSRTPLREALRALSSEGLVYLVPNRGAYVTHPSIQDIGHMFEVMSVLEGTCAGIAARKMGPEDRERLRRAHSRLEESGASGDQDGYLAANHEYHTMIEEMTGNPVLIEIVQALRQKILLYRRRQLMRPNRMQESLREHRLLEEQFQKGDPEGAEALMREHLARQYEALVSVYEAQRASERRQA